MLSHSHAQRLIGIGHQPRVEHVVPAWRLGGGLLHLIPRRVDVAVILIITGAVGMVVGAATLEALVLLLLVPLAGVMVGAAWRLFHGEDT